MSSENWLVVGVMGTSLLAMLWVGRRASARVTDLNSYVLAGRNLPWPVVALTFLATVASPVQLLGQPGFAYEHGWSLYFWEKIVVLSAVALLIIPLGRRLRGLGASTIADVGRARFPDSSRIHYVLTIGQMVWGVFVAALSVFGGSLLISTVTGLPLPAALTLIVGITLVYTILGGLRAVVLTDAAQWVVIIIGVGLFLPLLFVLADPFSAFFSERLGSGFDPTGVGVDAFRGGFTDLYTLPGASASVLAATAFLITSGCMGAADPSFAQRMLAARSDRDGRLGAYAFAVLYLLIALIILALGMYGRALLPGLEAPDQVLLLLADDHLPLIGKAVFLTAVASAATSTISSYLNVTAGVFVKNIVADRHPEMSPERQVLWTRIGTVLVAVAALLFAPVASGGLAVAAVAAQIILIAAVAPLIFLTLFWSRLTEPGAFWGFVSTAVVTLILIVAVGGPDEAVMGSGPLDIPVLFWGLGTALMVFGGVSLLDRRTRPAHPAGFAEYFAGQWPRVRPSRRTVIAVGGLWAVLLLPVAIRPFTTDRVALPPLTGAWSWLTDAMLLLASFAVLLATALLTVRLITYARGSLRSTDSDVGNAVRPHSASDAPAATSQYDRNQDRSSSNTHGRNT